MGSKASKNNSRNKQGSLKTKKDSKYWVVFITIFSFILSGSLMYFSTKIFDNSTWFFSIAVVIVIIFIGILFDMIGVSVTTANETPFHAMASKKYHPARKSIFLIRNAHKVASFCNDVIGDICGVISGAATALIIIRVSKTADWIDTSIFSLLLSALVASITIGGKAVGKSYAIRNSNQIVHSVSEVLHFFQSLVQFNKR